MIILTRKNIYSIEKDDFCEKHNNYTKFLNVF